MDKPITPDQAFALSFTPFRYRRIKTDKRGVGQKDKDGNLIYEIAETPRFIKQGETQANAIKRLRNHELGRTKQSKDLRRFPTFLPGMTTAAYVAQFESLNNLARTNTGAHLTNPAPMYDGDIVVLDTFADDLV